MVDIPETDVKFKYGGIAVIILSRRDLDSPPVFSRVRITRSLVLCNVL